VAGNMNEFNLIDRLKRSSGVTDDVIMRKVGIRYKPFIHF